jgi:hypothetical protein
MWAAPRDLPEDVHRAAHILSQPDVFLAAARAMLSEWSNSAEQNLTDMGQNRRSWIGQATCCHLAGVPESATRQAWWTLTAAEQLAANRVADQVITKWERAREDDRHTPLFDV